MNRNAAMLEPSDFVNLRKIVRAYTPSNFEEAQVAVHLDMKLNYIMQQMQEAQDQQKIEEALKARVPKDENDIPPAD